MFGRYSKCFWAFKWVERRFLLFHHDGLKAIVQESPQICSTYDDGRTEEFTITATGLSTFLIGLLPTYSSIGIAAPILLILLRCTQGLAVGGEYGMAAIYIAEYSPPNRRGLYTGFIQAAAIAGDFTSTIVVICQLTLGKKNFEEWGWRVPFLLFVVLLGISIYIRSKLHETPLFLKMKEAGTRSKAPLTESFTKWKNLRLVILTLFGAVAGQAAVNYASTLYGFFFITQTLKVETLTGNLCLSFVSLVCMAFNVLFGYLSDKIGRKPIIMAGCLLGGLTLYPIFLGLTHFLNPDLEHAMRTSPAVVIADPNECSVWRRLPTYDASQPVTLPNPDTSQPRHFPTPTLPNRDTSQPRHFPTSTLHNPKKYATYIIFSLRYIITISARAIAIILGSCPCVLTETENRAASTI